MGKRKQTKPQHAGEEKRQQLEWNMLDNGASHTPTPGSLSIIADNDPVLQEETEAAKSAAAESRHVPADSVKDIFQHQSMSSSVESSLQSGRDPITNAFLEFFRTPRLLDMFEDYLYQCVLCLTIHKEQNVQDKEWNFEMGKFRFSIIEHAGSPVDVTKLPDCQECWLYLAEEGGRHMIYFEVHEEHKGETGISQSTGKRRKSGSAKQPLQMFWSVTVSIPSPADFFQGMSGRYFQFVLGDFDPEKKEQEVVIYGREAVLMELSHPSEAFRPKPVHQSVQKLMQHFHRLGPMYDLSRRPKVKRHDFHELYEAVMRLQHKRKITVDVDVQHPSLKPRLRPYQRDSVTWMLQQERFKSAVVSDDTEPNCDLHPLYNEVSTNCGQTLYYNRHGGSLVRKRPVKVTVPPGGILADEMGLGKTVEVLCCMLLHPRPPVPLPPRLPTLMETEVDSDPEQSLDSSITSFSRRTSTQSVADTHEDQTPAEKKEDRVLRTPSRFGNDASWDSVNGEIVVSPDHNYSVSEKDLVVPREEAETAGGQQNVQEETAEMDHSYVTTFGTPLVAQSMSNLESEEVKNHSETAEKNGMVNGERNGLPLDLISTADEELSISNQQMDRGSAEKSITDEQCQDVKTEETVCKRDRSNSNASSTASPFSPITPSTQVSGGCSGAEGVEATSEAPKVFFVESEDSMDTTEKGDGQVISSEKKDTFSEGVKKEEAVPFDSEMLQPPAETTESNGLEELSQTSAEKSERNESKEDVPANSKVAKEPQDGTDEQNLSVDTEASKRPQKRAARKKSQKRQLKTKKSRKRSQQSSTQDESNTNDTIPTSENNEKELGESSEQKQSGENSTPRKNRRKSSNRFVELVPESEFKEADYFSTNAVKKKQYFECVCGKERDYFAGRKRRKWQAPYHAVECTDCGVSQHAECLNYDLNDPFRGNYKCPHCHVASHPVPSGATLIISPFQICHQWIEEIERHVQEKCIKVFVYTGVNKQGFIQPHTLASQDIVVTTYETLRKELDYVDLPHTNRNRVSESTPSCGRVSFHFAAAGEQGRRFRHPKRFMATPSPIIAVEWWRICLDEAQMVECVTTKTADMALRLSAVNRWCVTGTPLMRSVEDIYGLLCFLGVDPFWVQQWWRMLLWEPFCHGIKEPMHEALAKVLWRTAKKDVLDQIDLPQQTEEVTWLTFSPVEDHFYRHLYHKCYNEAMKNLAWRTDNSTKLNTLDRKTVSTLLRPLLNLRQACCHPQAVRGAFIPVQESMLTMEELLESLIKKAKLECEEAHRLLVAAFNGLAALHIIKKEPKEAVDLYREVLRSVEEHKAELRTDDLQQLHAMYNLQEILATKPEGVHPTLRDDQLGKQCAELRERYMTKARGYTNTSREQLAPLQQTVQELEEELDEGSDWWLEVLATAHSRGLGDELVYKVREDLTENSRPDLSSIIHKFREIRGLQYVIQTQLTEMETARRRLITDLKKLDRKGGQPLDVINKTVECCLRPAGASLKDCAFCKVHQQFMDYESKLFSFIDGGAGGGVDEEDRIYLIHNRRQGTWADSELEKTLKSLLSFARSNRVKSDILQYGATHIKLLDGWKKEFKQLRVLWMALLEEVQAVDELDMATTRLRVRLPEEPVPETPQPNILEATELDTHRLKLQSDRTVNRGELRKKLGQLMYLKNLSKSQENMKEGKNPDPCPVCQRELGREWSVLQCGHCYCMECIHALVSRYGVGHRCLSLKCPLCREMTHEGEISYVSMRQSEANDTSPSVKGSHSSKVAAITQCLLNIKQSDPHAKALVFSTWTDVLDVIGKALQENDITFTALHTAGKFQRNLTAFREKDEMQVLLLPFHSGANGLNLIEATHVLLVEPILNASQEAQAIGRVHRIGQTRPTKIYRFLVRRTIEERIHSLMESTLRPAAESTETTASADDNAMTIGQLASLFQDTLNPNRGDGEGGEGEEGSGGEEGEGERGEIAGENAGRDAMQPRSGSGGQSSSANDDAVASTSWS